MKYCVLLCGLLLMQAVGLSAKERARLQADDVDISRSGDSVHVSFRLKVESGQARQNQLMNRSKNLTQTRIIRTNNCILTYKIATYSPLFATQLKLLFF